MRGAGNLQRQLKVLARRHGVAWSSAPCRISLIAPPDHPTLILEGVASSPDIDRDRTRFAPRCFGSHLTATLPLFIEHDATRPAGTATLSYDAQGALRVRTSPITGDARRYGAFSIGAKIIRYEIHDADRRSFYAEVTQAKLTECSFTQHPHLDAARVIQRTRPAPMNEFYDHAQQYFATLSR